MNIYETYNPGSITGIDLVTINDDLVSVSDSADNVDTPCPGMFWVEISWDNPELVYGVAIHVDQSIIGSWNEIDAVELIGTTDPNTTSSGGQTRSGSGNSSSQNSSDYVYEVPWGASFDCDTGGTISNATTVTVVQMRSGFTYTATAIGLNGFDPVLGVIDASTGDGLCSDDDSTAAQYSAWLPTTGQVDPSSTSAQVRFSNNSSNAFANIDLYVGGFGNTTGEFILVLEGMALTSADGEGDPFSIQITPSMIESGVAPTAYMISVTNSFDPLIAVYDPDTGDYITDSDGNYFACDDGGTTSCWGESVSMQGSYISRSNNRQLGGGDLDPMLTLAVSQGLEGLYFNYMMRNAQDTFGDYIVAFHVGVQAEP